MDLAKIRKKSLQSLREPGDEHCAIPLSTPELVKNTLGNVPVTPVYAGEDSLPEESCFIPVESIVSGPPLITTRSPKFATSSCSPLEMILAGRSAAGCDDELILADDGVDQIVVESCMEYLCFRVSDEVYGINILDIKEIIKPRDVTEVPRAPAFVSGVLSLRGTIIPVIDMRVRLGLPHNEPTGKERVVVIKKNGSFSGLMVDEVTQVVKVPLDAVEAAPNILAGIDRGFISGLGRSSGQLIIILNLESVTDINLY